MKEGHWNRQKNMAVANALFDLSQNYQTWKTKTVSQK